MTEVGLHDECFFVAPIGSPQTAERRRSDLVLEFVVGPAAEALGLRTIRADAIAQPGQVTLQIIEHLLGARAVVADLTGRNPNVFYELAIRHSARLPVALIAERGELLPFDIASMRTIFFDHENAEDVDSCQEQLTAHLRHALDGAIDSPVATTLDLSSLRAGNVVERSLGELLTRVDELAATVAPWPGSRSHQLRMALLDMDAAMARLRKKADARRDQDLRDALRDLARPFDFVRRHFEENTRAYWSTGRRQAAPQQEGDATRGEAD